jgi:hypothetical protein
MAMVFGFRDLIANRRDNAKTARDNAWAEFQRRIRAVRAAQDAMDKAHLEFIKADKELERVR